MAEFAVNFGFLAQEYNTWFADEHRHKPRVTFDIVASRGTYLCGSESFFKSNLQGEEINPPSKNRANDSSHRAYPQAIATH